MNKIDRHRFDATRFGIEKSLDLEKMILSRLKGGVYFSFYAGKENCKRIMVAGIREQNLGLTRKNMKLWVDMGVEHFNRVLADETLEVSLGDHLYEVEAEVDNRRAGTYDCYSLFFPAYLSQYHERIDELFSFDQLKLCDNPDDYFCTLIEYLKALVSDDHDTMDRLLDTIRSMSQSNETIYHSLKGVSTINDPKTGIAEFRLTCDLPVIELLHLAYQQDDSGFNDYLANYLRNKKKYIIKKKWHQNWDHWIDFPALCCCAYALSRGISIDVESDYIPAWLYKREF